jgi:putative transposase
MSLIDGQYTRYPFYGSRRLTAWLNCQGREVNRKRIVRLMGVMGLEAIYPKPRLSQARKDHKKYPYLLRGIEITRRNQVWSADITYVRIRRGFLYLVAVLDWYSRYVLAWETSNTLDCEFCVEALKRALRWGRPEIFNTDQGVQFTSERFVEILEDLGIVVSMDGKGRALDNVFVERLWRSVKVEEVYLKDYETVIDGVEGLGKYFRFYNEERLHQSLGYQTPASVYVVAGMRKLRIASN